MGGRQPSLSDRVARAIALASLLVLVLAQAGAAFHLAVAHAAEPAAPDAPCESCCAHEDEGPAPADRDPSHDEEGCSLCRFLSQAPLPAALPAALPTHGGVEPAAVVRPEAPPADPFRIFPLARGPPASPSD